MCQSLPNYDRIDVLFHNRYFQIEYKFRQTQYYMCSLQVDIGILIYYDDIYFKKGHRTICTIINIQIGTIKYHHIGINIR